MKLNQSGLGIVQVLVATAMLGVLTLGVMQISKNMNDVNRNAHSSLDVLMLKQEMTSIANNSNDCSVSLVDNLPFKKSEIDDPETEGRNIELWYSDYKDKNRRSKRRFRSGDQFGNIKINKIKLVMNNQTNPAGSDYASGDFSDTGIIQVEVEKPENRGIKFQIPVNVNFSTDATNNSTISGCAGVSGSEEKLLVIHSQTTLIPDCPNGWKSEKFGYSFILASLDSGITSSQDLSDPGSCLDQFGSTVQIECEKTKCDYITTGDFTSWLLGDSGTLPSRCRVCSKQNGIIKVVHSQTSIIPRCPSGTTSIWSGYSLMGVSLDKGFSASFRLDGTGSCINQFKNGLPHMECDKKDSCTIGTGGDYATFLNAFPGSNDQGPKAPASSLTDISRCTVCLGVD